MIFEELKKYFKEIGVSQVQVAEVLDTSASYVNQLLGGKKSLGRATAKKLHDAYGLSTAWLLTGEGEMLAQQPEPQPTQTLNINGNRSSSVHVNNVNSGVLNQSRVMGAPDVDKAVLLERISMLERQLEEEKARADKLLDKLINMQ